MVCGYFNPPTPRGVGLRCDAFKIADFPFQSTHPLRGGTTATGHPPVPHRISIHPPLAGWDDTYQMMPHSNHYFNPPTPCGVGLSSWNKVKDFIEFQSTHPLRGGTYSQLVHICTMPISIHPPLAGWDLYCFLGHCYREHFNPPTPCGVGPIGGCAPKY